MNIILGILFIAVIIIGVFLYLVGRYMKEWDKWDGEHDEYRKI